MKQEKIEEIKAWAEIVMLSLTAILVVVVFAQM